MLANKPLKTCLKEHDYFEVKHTTGLLKHETRQNWFTLIIDGYGVNNTDKEHAEYLIPVLGNQYTMGKIGKENFIVETT